MMSILSIPQSLINTSQPQEPQDLTPEEVDRILDSDDHSITESLIDAPELWSNIQPHYLVIEDLDQDSSSPELHHHNAITSSHSTTTFSTSTSILSPLHPPHQQHHTPPPSPHTTHNTTPPDTNTTPSTTQPPIITTEAAFQELLALNQSKSSYLHHINILQHHLSNHTPPVDLTITTQPWIQLSAQLQETWDTTGIRDCTFITTLISHHKEL